MWGLELYLKSLKRKMYSSEGPEAGRTREGEMRVAAAGEDRPAGLGAGMGSVGHPKVTL